MCLYDSKTLSMVSEYSGNKDYENRTNAIVMDMSKGSKLGNQILTGSSDGIVRVLNYDRESKALSLKKEFYAATEPITSLTVDD